MKYWEVWIPRRKNSFNESHDKKTTANVRRLFEAEKQTQTLLSEIFKDPDIDSFLQTYKNNFANNLDDNKQYYSIFFYVTKKLKYTPIQLDMKDKKRYRVIFKTSMPYLTCEQTRIYLGFENREDAIDFADVVFYTFHRQDYKVEIYK